MSNDKLEFPIFDGKESITQFMKRAKEFEIKVKKYKYDLILEFVNVLVSNNYSSLTDFINVPNNKLTNFSHNKKIMDQYTEKLAKALNLNVFELTCITYDEEKDEYETNEIIIFLRKILNTIEYSLVSKIIDNEIYHSIKNRPNNIKSINNSNNTNMLRLCN